MSVVLYVCQGPRTHQRALNALLVSDIAGGEGVEEGDKKRWYSLDVVKLIVAPSRGAWVGVGKGASEFLLLSWAPDWRMRPQDGVIRLS